MKTTLKMIGIEIALWLVSLAIASLPFIAFGGTTGTIQLIGTIQENLSLTVSATSNARSLDLSSNINNLKVADVIESSNIANGYTVKVTSTNRGQLKHTNKSNAKVSYSLKYNGKAVNLQSPNTTVTDQNAQNEGTTKTKKVTVSYTASNSRELLAGSYVDTLTFEISAK